MILGLFSNIYAGCLQTVKCTFLSTVHDFALLGSNDSRYFLVVDLVKLG